MHIEKEGGNGDKGEGGDNKYVFHFERKREMEITEKEATTNMFSLSYLIKLICLCHLISD